MSRSQSSNHILMIEPVAFQANKETMETNSHQAKNPNNLSTIHEKAAIEHKRFRNQLIASGVEVSLYLGKEESPDDLFCNNWISTHSSGEMVLYPMLAANRRIERRPDIIEILQDKYAKLIDLTDREKKGVYLEGTGSIVLDRINDKAYAVRSPRTDTVLFKKWCQQMGYKPILFDYYDSNGIAEYHTNVVMWIGSEVAAVGLQSIPSEKERQMVMNELSATHKVIELSKKQIESFCGNALEVIGRDNKRMLAMSSKAYTSLNQEQLDILGKFYEKIIHSDLATIEKYGGGSARCMLLELF